MQTKVLKDRSETAMSPTGSAADPATVESGVAIVPGKPTAAMLAAGARAGGVTVEVAWKVYQAMIREPG